MKVGDRVRIDCPESKFHGKEATIWDISNTPEWGSAAFALGIHPYEIGYRLDVDGIGKTHTDGCFIAAPRRMLKPIQPLGSWEELSQIIGKDIRKPVEVTA